MAEKRILLEKINNYLSIQYRILLQNPILSNSSIIIDRYEKKLWAHEFTSRLYCIQRIRVCGHKIAI